MSTNGAGRRVANRYQLEVELGHGGMGVVWRATDTLLSRQVAVKEVDLPRGVDAAERDAMRARVTREARAAARLSHPGVVTVYDIATDGGRDFIVMELVPAPTLDDLVRAGGPLPPAKAARLGLGLLDTLEAAHRAGIVHRDLKPKNVMVREDGTTKLADFGIASVQGDPRLTATGLVVGSPSYMAPEQVEAQGVSPATDLWALGATLWFAVEGEPPFGGGEFQTLSAIVNGEPRRPQRLGPLAPVLTRLLAKDPERRPTPAELRPLLRRVAAGSAPAGPGHTPSADATVSSRATGGGWPPGGRPGAGDTPPVPSRARRRQDDGGTAVLRAPPARRGTRGRRLPPVPPVPAPGEPVFPGAGRRRPRTAVVLTVVAVVLAVVAVWQVGIRDGGGERPRRTPETRKPAVPAGWASFQDPDGTYRLSFPAGWAPVDRGAFTDFAEPGGDRFFRVQPTTDGTGPLPAQRSLESSFAARHPGDDYRRLRLGPTTFRKLRAAEWEFTFLDRGRPTRGYDITFHAGGRRHAILFQAPADRWAASRDELQAFLAGFRPRT
jgi:eukaryotic-like serine/threonine-protein kinase